MLRRRLADTGRTACHVEASPGRVWHDVVGVDGSDRPGVEVVDAPALVTVPGGVLLAPSTAHHRDEALCRERRAGEDVDLVPRVLVNT